MSGETDTWGTVSIFIRDLDGFSLSFKVDDSLEPISSMNESQIVGKVFG